MNLFSTRPRIETVSPLAGLATLGFGVMNTLLGLALAVVPGHFGPSVAAYALNYHLWAVLFGLSGLALTSSFLRNQWAALRVWLLISLCFKLIWLLALVIAFIVHPTSPVVLVLWLLITYLQALVYIYFPQPLGGTGHE